jgi:hypothetical protein
VALSKTDDPDIALHFVSAIAAMGAGAAEATDDLIGCMQKWNGKIADWARSALWQIGPQVIPALEAALQLATGPAKERLLDALSGMREPASDSQFAIFESLGKDDWVETFVHVVDMLGEHTMRWRDIAQEIQKKGDELPFSSGERILILNMSLLAEKLNQGPLTTHRKGGKGGGKLTEVGHRLATIAKQYLTMKQRRKGHHDH